MAHIRDASLYHALMSWLKAVPEAHVVHPPDAGGVPRADVLVEGRRGVAVGRAHERESTIERPMSFHRPESWILSE